MSTTATFAHPLTTRYASPHVQRLFSADHRIATWRRLWWALATAQRRLGLPAISDAALAELAAAIDAPIDHNLARREEQRLRHDVMAHVHTLAAACPAAAPVIHLGATSCFVACNGDLVVMKEALAAVVDRLAAVADALAGLAERHAALPVLGATHFQPAQLTTMGKRAALWLQDLMLDLEDLVRLRDTVPFRGAKGTTGTQASYLALFDGDHDKVLALDREVTRIMGFPDSARLPITAQTYPRTWDHRVLSALAGLAASASKAATDLRLLSGLGEVAEPMGKDQIGSSAMAYKRNPMKCERVCALARHVAALPNVAWGTAASQWLERTLDDSAARRIILPEAFLATDAILVLLLDVFQGLDVFPGVIRRRINAELPFMATENIIMAMVRHGGDRQVCHEKIRVLSLAAAERVKAGDGVNDLVERVRNDAYFEPVWPEMDALLDPSTFTGRACEQVHDYLAEHARPLLAKVHASSSHTVEAAAVHV